MEAADTVYGVTMEENGISKLLSMKLAQSKVADQENNISIDVKKLIKILGLKANVFVSFIFCIYLYVIENNTKFYKNID